MTTTTTLPNASAVQGGNPLRGLLAHGQSPWLDFIRRDILLNGDLKKMIANDGLRGMTSNPAIFEKAITGSDDYNDLLNSPEAKKLNAKGLYEQIAIRDVQTSADIFRSVYDETKGRDGFVSLEVSPTLANDTQGTIEEARRLWKAVNRPNLMVKVPATREGIPAIRQLLEDGLNINITLLFAQSAYEQVAEAYLSALEARAAKGQDVSKIASVASFFVSRIDTLIDGQIDARLKTEMDGKKKELLASVQGKVAIANARRTYAKYQQLFDGARWKALESKGARTQRLLWASTSTKNKNYRDVLYVEELIGADTVDTIPPATFDAFRDHGKLRDSLTENVPGANKTMADLEAAGISMKEVTDKLIADGVRLFAEAFTTLLAAVEKHAGVRA
jgi:transaldolase / glucose-6-phosphate isomerase